MIRTLLKAIESNVEVIENNSYINLQYINDELEDLKDNQDIMEAIHQDLSNLSLDGIPQEKQDLILDLIEKIQNVFNLK